MNISQIFSVLAVEEHKNFSHAADSLFLSQPALSLQISKLEAELGYSLFLRHPQGVTLTPEGKIFCELAQTVADAWNNLQQATLACRKNTRTQIRIGLGPRVFSNDLFEHIVAFFAGYPEIEPTFITETGINFWDNLESGSLDVVLDRPPPNSMMHNQKLFFIEDLIGEKQCLLCSADHPFSAENTVSFSMLEGCTLVTGTADSLEDHIIRDVFHQHDVAPAHIFRAEGINPIIALVRSGKGITLGPRSFEHFPGIKALTLEPGYAVSLCFICLYERARVPELAKFRSFLSDLCKWKGDVGRPE